MTSAKRLPRYLYKTVQVLTPERPIAIRRVHRLTWLGWLYFAPSRIARAIKDALWLV